MDGLEYNIIRYLRTFYRLVAGLPFNTAALVSFPTCVHSCDHWHTKGIPLMFEVHFLKRSDTGISLKLYTFFP